MRTQQQRFGLTAVTLVVVALAAPSVSGQQAEYQTYNPQANIQATYGPSITGQPAYGQPNYGQPSLTQPGQPLPPLPTFGQAMKQAAYGQPAQSNSRTGYAPQVQQAWRPTQVIPPPPITVPTSPLRLPQASSLPLPSSSRVDHVLEAARHLERAGLKMQATQLRRHAESLKNDVRRKLLAEKLHQLEILKRDISRLQAEIGENGELVMVQCSVIELSRDKLRKAGVDFTRLDPQSGKRIDEAMHSGRDQMCVIDGGATLLKKVRSLQENGLAKVVARPQMMTTSGQAAMIHVGGRHPVVQRKEGVVRSLEYRDFGIKMSIEPRVETAKQLQLMVKFEQADGPQAQKGPWRGDYRTEAAAKLNSGQTLVIFTTVKNPRTDSDGGLLIFATPQIVDRSGSVQSTAATSGTRDSEVPVGTGVPACNTPGGCPVQTGIQCCPACPAATKCSACPAATKCSACPAATKCSACPAATKCSSCPAAAKCSAAAKCAACPANTSGSACPVATKCAACPSTVCAGGKCAATNHLQGTVNIIGSRDFFTRLPQSSQPAKQDTSKSSSDCPHAHCAECENSVAWQLELAIPGNGVSFATGEWIGSSCNYWFGGADSRNIRQATNRLYVPAHTKRR